MHLRDGDLGILSFGVQPGHQLQIVDQFRKDHLSYTLRQGDIVVNVHPAILFLDFKTAFEKAQLADPTRKLNPKLFYWPRNRSHPEEKQNKKKHHSNEEQNKEKYWFSVQELRAALDAAGHVPRPDPATTGSAANS